MSACQEHFLNIRISAHPKLGLQQETLQKTCATYPQGKGWAYCISFDFYEVMKCIIPAFASAWSSQPCWAPAAVLHATTRPEYEIQSAAVPSAPQILPDLSNTSVKRSKRLSLRHCTSFLGEMAALSAPPGTFTDISKAQLWVPRSKQGRRLPQDWIIHHLCLLQGYFDVQYLSLPAVLIQINGWYLWGLYHFCVVHY